MGAWTIYGEYLDNPLADVSKGGTDYCDSLCYGMDGLGKKAPPLGSVSDTDGIDKPLDAIGGEYILLTAERICNDIMR